MLWEKNEDAQPFFNLYLNAPTMDDSILCFSRMWAVLYQKKQSTYLQFPLC